MHLKGNEVIFCACQYKYILSTSSDFRFSELNSSKTLLASMGELSFFVIYIKLKAPQSKEAQLAIMVCADLSKEKSVGFWVQDCSAATENILIEAF